MVGLLARIFIRNFSDYGDADVRRGYGILCGAIGVAINVALCVFKFVFGVAASSVAMVADAFNNLTDAASSVVQMAGFKMASKGPDGRHPYGHGRMEYVAGLVISFLIVYVGVELVRKSVSSFSSPREVAFSVSSGAVMAVSMAAKLYMFIFNRRVGRKISSVAMEATARDSLGDVAVTAVALAGMAFSSLTDFPLDAVGGALVGVFILRNGVVSFRDTVSPLIGEGASAGLVGEIERVALSHHPIFEIHDVMVHDYGPGRMVVSLHAEVPGNVDVFALHDALDAAERDISMKFGCQALIHMDPVDVGNGRLMEIRDIVREEAEKVDPGLKVHDVRMVETNEGRRLYFELLKPPALGIPDRELGERMRSAVQERVPEAECVVREINTAYI